MPSTVVQVDTYRDLVEQAVAEQHRHRAVMEQLRAVQDNPHEHRRLAAEYRLELGGGPRARLR